VKTLNLKDILKNTGSAESGDVLLNHLKKAYQNNQTILLQVDSDLVITPSFLNCSAGEFIDIYGFSNFRNTLKIRGSQSQFNRFNKYIQDYKELYQ